MHHSVIVLLLKRFDRTRRVAGEACLKVSLRHVLQHVFDCCCVCVLGLVVCALHVCVLCVVLRCSKYCALQHVFVITSSIHQTVLSFTRFTQSEKGFGPWPYFMYDLCCRSYARKPQGTNQGAEHINNLFMMRFTMCFWIKLVTSSWRHNGAAMVPQSAPPVLYPLVRAHMSRFNNLCVLTTREHNSGISVL